jgi:hypothetical protein
MKALSRPTRQQWTFGAGSVRCVINGPAAPKKGAIPLSKNHVTEAALKQSSVAEAIAPTALEAAPTLHVLESEAREFLIAQGIATADAFLSIKAGVLSDALMDWRALSRK